VSEQPPPAGERGRVEDPMSADRRTLVTAAVAMVALIIVGVVGAAIFTRSACSVLVPSPVASSGPSGDVDAVLGEALGDLSDEDRGRLLDGLEGLAGAGGGVVLAADAGGAVALTELGGHLAATGETTTVLPAADADAAMAAELDEDATIVGDGAWVYATAIVNELTGQVDALAPLGPDLAEQDCTDTATVGVPLAFHLAAGDGRLLLFRVDDDGDDPHLELRGPDGPLWNADVAVGSGPPGVLAERLTARLGEDLLVTARRSLADEDAPALVAHDLGDGEQRWTLAPDDLAAHAPSGEAALAPRVVAVEPDVVVVALSREADQPAATLLVGLDPDDGSLLWTSDLGSQGTQRLVGELGEDLVLLTFRDDLLEAVALDRTDGGYEALHATSGQLASAAVLGDEVLLAVDRGVTRIGPDDVAEPVELPGRVADIEAHDGRAALLLESDEGAAVVWLELGANR
jgi:hypothetical protein